MAVGVAEAIGEVSKAINKAITLWLDPRLQKGRRAVRHMKRMEKALDIAERYILKVKDIYVLLDKDDLKELKKLESKFFKYD